MNPLIGHERPAMSEPMTPPAALTLPRLNAAGQDDFTALLNGTYEHSPWVAREAWAARPFAAWAHDTEHKPKMQLTLHGC